MHTYMHYYVSEFVNENDVEILFNESISPSVCLFVNFVCFGESLEEHDVIICFKDLHRISSRLGD